MDTELHILSCCLLDPRIVGDLILAGTQLNWFKDTTHRKCFNGMLNRMSSGLPIDTVWVADYMGSKYLETLIGCHKEILVPKNECMTALAVLEKKYKQAEISAIIFRIQQGGYENPDELIERMITQLTDLKRVNKPKANNSKVKENIINELNRGIETPTGFPRLDFMIKGVQPSTLTVIGGHTSHGKSIFALNIAKNVAEKNNKVMIFSTEMNEEQLTRRLAMMFSGVNPSTAYSLTPEEKNMFIQAIDMAQELPIYVLKTLSLPTIRLNIQKSKAKLYIVDYIQMIIPDYPIENDVRRLGYVVRELETMSKIYNCCIIATSQFSRPQIKDKSYTPSGFSYRGSGEIEECVDIAILMYYPYQHASFEQREKLVTQNKQNVINIEIWKNRLHGLTGMMKLKFDKKSLIITEVNENEDE